MMISVFQLLTKMTLLMQSLDPFEDPQETPAADEDDLIRTDIDKEP